MKTGRQHVQWLGFFLLAFFSTMLVSCTGDSSSDDDTEALRIYEMVAGNGLLTPDGESADKFSLNLGSVPESILYFTDRPAQKAGFVELGHVIDTAWPKVYGQVPPNALLRGTTVSQEYIELFCVLDSPVYHKTAAQLDFNLTFLDGSQKPEMPLSFTDVKLVILNNAQASTLEWSEVLLGNVASFKPTATEGTYTFTIQSVFDPVFSYTNAPNRLSATIPILSYVQSWPSRFGDSPPNVSISYGMTATETGEVQVVTLSDPIYNQATGELSFTAKRLFGTEAIPSTGMIVVGPTLFIDGGKSTAFTLTNKSGQDLYVYDFSYLQPQATQASFTLTNGKSKQISLTPNKSMRVYFSNEKLTQSIENGQASDVFNYHVDAAVTYSFMEYLYEPSSSRYTFDLSYIDEYSYPLTVKFSNVPDSYKGCETGHEYGFTSLAAVKNNLKKQTDYRWDALIWPAVVQTDWDSEKYPKNMHRIIGPNKIWTAQQGGAAHGGPWTPYSYGDFMASLPWNGMQLFNSTTNWSGWQTMTQADNPGPSFTSYAKALHDAATADKKGKFGFFVYPQDNTSGEFTYVPDSVGCTVTIYPCDK